MGRTKRIHYLKVTEKDDKGETTVTNYFPQTIRIKAWTNNYKGVHSVDISWPDEMTRPQMIEILKSVIDSP